MASSTIIPFQQEVADEVVEVPMRITVRGGTVKHGDAPLCHTCRFATIVRGVAQRDEIIECDQLSCRQQRLTFPVTFCTRYVNAQHPSLRELEEIAWVMRSDTKKNTIGFVRSSDLAPRRRFVLADDDF
jgi:hypothetical protein